MRRLATSSLARCSNLAAEPSYSPFSPFPTAFAGYSIGSHWKRCKEKKEPQGKRCQRGLAYSKVSADHLLLPPT